MKEELGLDHFEGRSWTGLHRHALMTMIALAFLQHIRLRERGKKRASTRRATTTANLARGSAQDPRTVPFPAHLLPTLWCSASRNATA
jgi:hypothetical protein